MLLGLVARYSVQLLVDTFLPAELRSHFSMGITRYLV